MDNQPTKICTKCEAEKPLSEMETFSRNGTRYYRGRCKQCTRDRNRDWYQKNKTRHLEKSSVRRKTKRQQEPDWAIHQDALKSDRKHGRDNDLTREFIRESIGQGCSYCGETALRMTLDRIDNTRGHLMSNVVPACIRCNYTRKDMPHQAWLVLVPAIRQAREQGLFKDWTGRARES